MWKIINLIGIDEMKKSTELLNEIKFLKLKNQEKKYFKKRKIF